MHLESTRFSPSPESETFSKHTLVRKSRTSWPVFQLWSGTQAKNFGKDLHLPRPGDSLFLQIQKEAPPRFGGAVRVLVCAVRVVFVCAVRVFVSAVSILFVMWAI